MKCLGCKCTHATTTHKYARFDFDKKKTRDDGYVSIIGRGEAYGSFKVITSNIDGEQYINCYRNEHR